MSFAVSLKMKNFRMIKKLKLKTQTVPYLRRFMEKKKEIVMSGIRPTGFLHLGNYFGAIP